MKRKSSYIFVAICFALFYLSCAPAEGKRKSSEPTVEQVAAAYKQATKGNAKAQYFIAMVFSDNELLKKLGMEMSEEESMKIAIEWLEKSAAQRYAEAEVILGWYYSVGGWGVKLDEEKARALYLDAALQGNTTAKGVLNIMEKQKKEEKEKKKKK